MSLANLLQIIFLSSLACSKFHVLKEDMLSPVNIGRSKTNAKSYGLISVTTHVSKAIEDVRKRLITFVEENTLSNWCNIASVKKGATLNSRCSILFGQWSYGWISQLQTRYTSTLAKPFTRVIIAWHVTSCKTFVLPRKPRVWLNEKSYICIQYSSLGRQTNS